MVEMAPGGSLPPGFGIALDPGVRRVGDGTVLVGGTPIRLLRLTAPGRDLVDRLARGEPVPGSAAAQGLARRLLDAGLAHPRPPATAPPLDVAVVIPVYDDPGGLAATLTTLFPSLGANGRAGLTTVVVDDASAEPVVVKENRTPPGTRLVRRAERGGPAAARNDGWKTTGGSLVAFVDANCEPDSGWLDALLPHFADPLVGAVAPRIVPAPTPATAPWLTAYERVASPLDLGPREAIVRPGSLVAYLPTAAMVVRRSAVRLSSLNSRVGVPLITTSPSA
jgi:mycofactocin system glycosyltransferase